MNRRVTPAASTTADGHLLLTVDETAAALQIGRNTVYGLIQRGELPVVPFGRTIRVSRVALERWIEQRSVPVGASAE